MYSYTSSIHSTIVMCMYYILMEIKISCNSFIGLGMVNGGVDVDLLTGSGVVRNSGQFSFFIIFVTSS